MPLDVGRVSHLLEQMHRSEDDAGDPIPVDKVLVTDGARGFTWEDYAGGDFILRYGGGAEWHYDHGGTPVGATETIDLADGNAHSIILDVNTTLTFTGAVGSIDGQDVASSFILKVVQDATGGNTITWPGSVVWPGGVAPTLDTAGDAIELLTFWTDDGGSTWYGFHAGGGVALSDDTPLIESGAGDAGVSAEASRADHVHPEFGSGSSVPPPILLASDHAVPFDFGDILQNSDGDDFLWASE